MARKRDYTWLLANTKFVVYNNEGQADQVYVGPSTDPNLHFREAINRGYEELVEEAKQETSFDYWRRTEDIVWASDLVVLELPFLLSDKQFLSIRDVTDGDDGTSFAIANSPDNGDVWLKSYNKLQWGTTGPGSNRTLRISYFADAEYIGEHPNQEPKLIPYKYRWTIVYAAAIALESVGNRQAPGFWEKELDKLKLMFFKSISRGTLMESGPPVIRMTDNSF